MATRTITTRLELSGEAEYKAALKNINAELGLYKSELEKVEAQNKTSANTLEALSAKEAALKGQLDALNRKHEEQSAMLEKAAAAQQKYTADAEQLRAELEKLKTSTGDTSEQEKKLAQELAEAEANMQKAQNSVIFYQRQLNNTEKEQANLNNALTQTGKYLDEAKNSADGCASSIDQYGREVKDAGEDSENFGDKASSAVNALAAALAAAGVAKAINEIAAALRACVDASMEFETALAGVQRTVGISGDELEAFGDAIAQMAVEMPITTTELGKIAETAGQLGIAKNDVETFTKIMAELGTTTDLTAENAATMLAQFANITGLTDYERLGSTVAELGDATATTASKVVEMSQGMAAAANMAGFQETEILALAASVGSLGIEAQAGSTAMSTLISTLYKAVETGSDKLAEFAAVAGMSADQFAAAWREDAAKAFEAFISGLDDVDRNGRSAIVILDELGITNVRQTKAILGLASAGDLLSNTIDQANQAWEDNTALAEKAGIMYETLESKAAMCENAFGNLKTAIGNALAPTLEDLAKAGTEAFSWAAEFVDENPWLVQAITGATTAVGLLAAGLTAYTVVAKLAKLVQEELNIAMSLCPVMAVAAAIGALIAVVAGGCAAYREANAETYALIDASDALIESLHEQRDAFLAASEAITFTHQDTSNLIDILDELLNKENQTAADRAMIVQLVEQLNEAIPDLVLAYDAETNALNMSTEALQGKADAYMAEQQAAANTSYQLELLAQQRSAEADLAELCAEKARLHAEAVANGATIVVDSAGSMSRAEADLTKQIEEARAALAELNVEIAASEVAATAVSAAVKALGTDIDGLTDSVEGSTEAAEANTAAHATLTDILGSTKDAYQLLAKAQNEVNDSGSVSIDTLETLLGQYPQLQKYLVENADGYGIAEGALEDYLAAQRAEYQMVYDNAASAAQEVIDTEALKAKGYDTTTMSIKAQLQAMAALYQAQAQTARAAVTGYSGDGVYRDSAAFAHAAAQAESSAAVVTANQNYASVQKALASLNAAESTLNTYTRAASMLVRDYGGSGSSSSSSSGSSGSSSGSSSSTSSSSAAKSTAEASQAEQDLAIYKELKAELDHEKAMDLVDTAAYYEKLQALQQTYLTGAANLSEYRKVEEEIYKYTKELAAAQQEALREQLDDFLNDADHRIFLWTQWGNHEEDILAQYREMQEQVHAMAQSYRAQGYDAESSEIQELQKLWWGYQADILSLKQEMYDQALASLEDALNQGEISWDEYMSGRLEAQNTYFSVSSAAWQSAEEARLQAEQDHWANMRKAMEDAYDDLLADQKYFLDMGLITQAEYYEQMAILRDAYLEEDSDKWRQANVAIYKYQQSQLESTLNELKSAYDAQVSALKSALAEEKSALAAAYKEAKAAEKMAYDEKKAAAKAAYEDKKAAIQAELELEKARLNAILDGINAEVQARRELREDEDLDSAIAKAQKRLEAAQAELAFARTDEDRVEWEKEVIRRQAELAQALQNKEDTEFYREKELEKEAIQDQINDATAAAKAAQEAASAEYNAALARLGNEYDAALVRLESEYNASLEQLEADYQTNLKRLEDMYNAAVAQAEDEARREAQEAARANAQRSAQASAAGASAAGVISSTSQTIQNASNTSTSKINNVSVTINHQGSSLTEGQVSRIVASTVNTLDK